jgi:hypothetical protein
VSVVGEEMEKYRKSVAVSSRYSGGSFDEEEEAEDGHGGVGKAE